MRIKALLLFLLWVTACRAQFGFDVLSVEASINDHKRMRSVLMARSGIEQANVLLHQYSSEAATAHKDITVKLEAYTKAFDKLDLILQGTATAFTLWNTIEDVSTHVGKYKDLLQRYSDMCLSRGNIMSSDTLIIGVCQRLIGHIGDDVDQLVTSYYDIVAYVSGFVPCKTSVMLEILGKVNGNLEDISVAVRTAYLTLWKYITLRTGYWKSQIYRAKSMREMANDAFSNWRKASKELNY